jgi:hypothetical protein
LSPESESEVNMSKLLKLKRRGFAIPLAVIAVVTLLAIGVGLLSLGLNSRIFAVRTTSDIVARSAADAGLAKALFEMNEKLKVKPWDGDALPGATNVNLTNCDAVFSYAVTGGAGGNYTIQATGNSAQAQREVSCNLQLRGPFEAAIFTQGPITLKNSAEVDWYNYDENDDPLRIGTNSTESGAVTLANRATIDGDVAVGVGGDPDVAIDSAPGATITGETYPLTEEVELTPVTVPRWLQLWPSYQTITDGGRITHSGKYRGIDLKQGETIKIDGNVSLYIVGDMVLGNRSELQIQEDSSLTLYLGGDLECKNSSDINNETQDPSKLKIYGLEDCESMQFKNSSDFYGAIYAPSADVVMHNSADIYGAVVAGSFESKNSSTFNYDASLRDTDANDEIVRFTVRNWHEQ